MKIVRLGCSGLVGLLLLSTGFAAPPTPAALGLDAAKLKDIPERMQQFVDYGVIAGAVTLVARREGVASLAAVGYSDLGTKRPMWIDDLFWIASDLAQFYRMILNGDGSVVRATFQEAAVAAIK